MSHVTNHQVQKLFCCKLQPAIFGKDFKDFWSHAVYHVTSGMFGRLTGPDKQKEDGDQSDYDLYGGRPPRGVGRLAPSRGSNQRPSSQSAKPAHDEDEEENCRACGDFQSWLKSKRSPTYTSNSGNAGKTSKDLEEELSGLKAADWHRSNCPADRGELGRSSWTLLHSIAAYYPVKPTPAQQADVSQFMDILSRVYPCDHCASHLREDLQKMPPQTESRNALSLWMCKLHNSVNSLLGKDQFDCSRVLERWRNGPADGSCD